MAKPRRSGPVYGRVALTSGIVAIVLFAAMTALLYGASARGNAGLMETLGFAVCLWVPVYLGVIVFGLVCGVLSLLRKESPRTKAWVGIALCVASLTWFVLPSIFPRG